jgi:hypothetical protein
MATSMINEAHSRGLVVHPWEIQAEPDQVYIYIHTCVICIFKWTCMYIFVYIQIHEYLCAFVYIFMHILKYTFMYVYLYLFIYI